MRPLLFLLVALAAPAFADIVLSNEDSCRGKKAGEACRGEMLDEGVCTPAKCGRNDYSEGTPPKKKLVDCLKCLPPQPDAGVKKTKPAVTK